MNSKVQQGKKDSSFRAETQPMKSHGLQVARVVKNPPTNAGDLRDCGSILERERSSRVNVNRLQYFSILAGRIPWMEEDMGRGVWQATVQGATKSQTARASEYTLFTRTYSFLYLPKNCSLSVATGGLAHGSSWLLAPNYHSLLILNVLIFSGKISGSLFVSGHKY